MIFNSFHNCVQMTEGIHLPSMYVNRYIEVADNPTPFIEITPTNTILHMAIPSSSITILYKLTAINGKKINKINKESIGQIFHDLPNCEKFADDILNCNCTSDTYCLLGKYDDIPVSVSDLLQLEDMTTAQISVYYKYPTKIMQEFFQRAVLQPAYNMEMLVKTRLHRLFKNKGTNNSMCDCFFLVRLLFFWCDCFFLVRLLFVLYVCFMSRIIL